MSHSFLGGRKDHCLAARMEPVIGQLLCKHGVKMLVKIQNIVQFFVSFANHYSFNTVTC